MINFMNMESTDVFRI